jgi:hypothetical protein
MGDGIEGQNGGKRMIDVLLEASQQSSRTPPLPFQGSDIGRRHAQENRLRDGTEERKDESQGDIEEEQIHWKTWIRR